MPYFCKVDDIASAVPVATRFSNQPELCRRAASESIVQYTRRNWDYNAAYVEYFDSTERQDNDVMKIHLAKVPVDTTVPFDIRFSYDRLWDSTTLLVAGTDYVWDSDREVLFIYNLYRMRKAYRSYRIQYAGGLTLALDNDGNPTDVYNVTGKYEILQTLAIQEAADRLENFVNRTEGEAQRGARADRTLLKPRRGGLLAEVAFALEPYRRILMESV